ncbi:DUF551 domain-containing protein [Escherichia coli]|uniref:DUF551 domain-containing protein n=1 Tax=Escherichia coli TaxID=562 RepID=UPI0014192FFB|nr:DUF551 domain-containing protein [Escherichia coli]KAF3727226.1 hypothetical protein FM731_004574 [Escherichia coli]
MTTITKERLLTIKQWRETYGPGSNVVLPAEEAEELARIALAALEVEPIGFRCRRNDNLGDWSYVYHREPDDFERKHLVIEGIYAAPPVPVVPEEKPMPNPLSMYAVDAVAAIAEVRGWNACRAAMLQSQNNGIKDGWISCSERMPEKGQNVLISVNFDSSLVEPLICSARYTGSTFRRGDATIKPGNGIEQATHWMPLPEPPQESKSE